MPEPWKLCYERNWGQPMLDLRPEWLETVRRLIAAHIPEAEVWAYGSRVQGASHDGSDLDLVVRNLSDPSQPQSNLSELRDAFSESNLPILVDLLDWARIPDSFRQEIIRGGMVPVQDGNAHSGDKTGFRAVDASRGGEDRTDDLSLSGDRLGGVGKHS